ncbi:MAG: peroxiredoxin [Rhodospirillaceae bacterium]
MAVETGSVFPSVTVKYLAADGMQEISTDEIFKGNKVVLFALPGAFTPTCSAKHLPGFVEKAAALKAKGVARIVCLSVNDPFVMKAWGQEQKVGDAVFLLPDGNGAITRALGLEFDATAFNLGIRSQRYAAIVDNGVIAWLAVDKPGAFEVSSADAVLAAL